MVKRKAASTRKTTRSKATGPSPAKGSRPTKPRGATRPARTAKKKTKTAASARPAKARKKTTPPATRRARKPQRATASTRPPAPPTAAPAPPRTPRVDPEPRPRSLPLTIVEEPEDGWLEPATTSSLDPDRRPRLPVVLAELEDDHLPRRRGDVALQAGDLDADGERAYFTGDETPGGENPTPDQDVVDYIGRSLGVEYEDDEELQGANKIAERDRHRWELDPASADEHPPRRR